MLGPVLSIQSFSRALDAPNPLYAVGDYHKESYTLNLQLLLLVLGVVGAGLMEAYKVYHSWQKRHYFALITDFIVKIDDENCFPRSSFIDIKLTDLPHFRLEKIDGLITVVELNQSDEQVGLQYNTGVTLKQLQAKLAIDIVKNNLKKNLTCKPIAAMIFFEAIARPDLYGENYSDRAKQLLGEMVTENYESYARYCQQNHKNQQASRSFEHFIYKKIKAKFIRHQLVKAGQPLAHRNQILEQISKHITSVASCCAVEAIRPYLLKPPQRAQELTLINQSSALFDQVLSHPAVCNRAALVQVCDFFNELVRRTPPVVMGLGIALTLDDYITIYQKNCREGNKLPKTCITSLKIILAMCLACIPVECIAAYLSIDSSARALARLKIIGSEHLNQLATYFSNDFLDILLADIDPTQIKELMNQCSLEQLKLVFYRYRPDEIKSRLQGGASIKSLVDSLANRPA